MTPDDQYVLDCIKTWVWSGFYSADQIDRMIDDVVVPGCDVAFLKASVQPEVERKLTAQDAWPAETDCDRLDKVVRHLHGAGICALQNAGYTMSDGRTDVAEAVAGGPKGYYRGFCFYHGQDVERAVKGQGLHIAFGAIDDDRAAGVAVGCEIVEALRHVGFAVEWDGSIERRINVPAILWQRRSPGQRARTPTRHGSNCDVASSATELSGVSTGFHIFYHDHRPGGLGSVDPKECLWSSLDEIKAYMGAVLVYDGNFFGIIDRFDETVQFAVNPDGSVHSEFVIEERRGAMATTMTLSDAITLVSQAGPSLATLSIPGATFQPW
jgi:hypothetical protein